MRILFLFCLWVGQLSLEAKTYTLDLKGCGSETLRGKLFIEFDCVDECTSAYPIPVRAKLEELKVFPFEVSFVFQRYENKHAIGHEKYFNAHADFEKEIKVYAESIFPNWMRRTPVQNHSWNVWITTSPFYTNKPIEVYVSRWVDRHHLGKAECQFWP